MNNLDRLPGIKQRLATAEASRESLASLIQRTKEQGLPAAKAEELLAALDASILETKKLIGRYAAAPPDEPKQSTSE
jgi:hypothetical protein